MKGRILESYDCVVCVEESKTCIRIFICDKIGNRMSYFINFDPYNMGRYFSIFFSIKPNNSCETYAYMKSSYQLYSPSKCNIINFSSERCPLMSKLNPTLLYQSKAQQSTDQNLNLFHSVVYNRCKFSVLTLINR